MNKGKTLLRSDQVRRYVNTTAYWNAHATVIPKEGDIYIYSDGASYEKDGDTVTVPRMKVGDGVRPLSQLPFVDDFQKGTLTIKRNNEILGSFPADSPEDKEINISVPVVVTTGSDGKAGIVFDMSPGEMQSEILSGACVMMKYREQIYYVGYCNGKKIPTIYGFSYDGNHTLQRLYIKNYAMEKTVWQLEETSIPAVNDAILTVQKNGTPIDTFSANASEDKTINITVPITAADVSALPSSTKYGASLSLSVNSSTYVVTAQLKDQDGNNIGAAQTIDLPLESVVVSGSYNKQTKKVVLTLQNGSTIEFSVADLVAGLQSEITPENPLSADLVVDGNVNKVFTLTMKHKLDGIEEGAEVNVQSDWNQQDDTADDFIKNKPDLDAILYEEITYSQLVTKINNSQLVKGRKYRITDYVTTTTQANTSSAGHVFDLVVTAIDVNKLDCNASALLHSEDTYFSTAGADLGKWQVWYDVNNDTTKYAWADATNGKGVIYRMIDEWGNDCPYDFKNILFTKANEYTSVYTFNKFASGDTANSDYSLNNQYRVCYENIICAYYKVYGGVNRRNLNFNVFLTIDSTSTCSSNTFESNCYDNQFGDACSNNQFFNRCYNNTFGNNCSSNIFKNYCSNNTFGNNCFDNILGNNCKNNKFGNYCYQNTLENNCNYIIFGNSSNQGGSYVISLTIKSGNSYIRIYNTTLQNESDKLQNIYIAQGCSGTYSTYTEISTIERNLSYRTTVGRDSSGNIRIYNEDDQPTITDEKVKQTVDATTTEYPLLMSAQSSPTSGEACEAKYSASLKGNGEGDVVFDKDSTKCRLRYNSTDLCLNFVFE